MGQLPAAGQLVQLASIFFLVLWKQVQGNVARGGINRASGNRSANRWSVGRGTKESYTVNWVLWHTIADASESPWRAETIKISMSWKGEVSRPGRFLFARAAPWRTAGWLTNRGVRELSSNFSLFLFFNQRQYACRGYRILFRTNSNRSYEL